MKDIDDLKTWTNPPSAGKRPAGTVLAGKYTILGELGKGGMGEVFLARDSSLDREVALKFLPESFYRDPAMRGRFIHEAKAAAALSHPYICSIHEVGEAEDRLFFAMEFVEGKNLRERISQGPLPLEEALLIASEIAEALRFAHEKGLIHRDIKPANVMLTKEGHAKVMDFGLAKHFVKTGLETGPAELTRTATDEGLTPGTLAYMSPEQLRGEDLDQRSDIFSFGVLLYEMLGGRHPFKGESGLTIASAILNEEPQPIAKVIEDVPEDLQKAVDRMLAKDAGKRYPSMAEVHADLKKTLEEIQGRKVRPFVKPLRLAVTAAVILAAVLGAAWLARTLFFAMPARALAFQERDWILITDFENKTGEGVFDGSLETALTVSIQQSQYVNVFPPSRVKETLKRMRRADVKKIDEAVGREVALREGIKGLLVCGIGKVGSEYLLTVKLVDPEKQTAVYSDSTRTKAQDDILGGVDALAKKIRHKLGESLAMITRQQRPLYTATTSSLEALKAYSRSIKDAGDAAFPLLHQAVELDPDFALAHAELGMKYYIGNNRVKGEEHFQKALGLLDRLTTREKLWIRALVEDWRGNRLQGIQNYVAYLEQYPDDSSAWFRLGYAYMVSTRLTEAIAAFKRMTEIDRDSAAAYVNMATCLNSLRKNEESLSVYQKAFALNPELMTGLYVNGEYGFMLVRMGRIRDAEQAFTAMISQPENWKKSRGNRSLAFLRMYEGRYAEAEEFLRKAIGLNRAAAASLNEFRDHLFLAMAFRTKRMTEAFGREMAAAEQIRSKLKIEPFFMSQLGILYARSKRLPDADRILGDVKSVVGDLLASSGISRSNQTDEAAYHRLKGEIELARGRTEDALNSFGLVASLRDFYVEDSLALAYFESGQIDKAIEHYRTFVGRSSLGSESQDDWVLAHYRLGLLFEKKGDGAEAAKSYARFLEIWKDADPNIPELADARRRLQKLGPR